MKTTVERKGLLNALSVAFKAISSKSPLPILTHFLLEAGGGRLKISATDSDLGIETAVSAEDSEPGAFTTPAKTFMDIISLIQDDYVTIVKDEEGTECRITTEDSSCTLMTLSPEDFPIIPRFDADPDFIITQNDLRRAVRNVLFSAASHEETRAILTGVCLTVSEGRAEFAATDARRLAVTSVPVKTSNQESRSYVVPRRTLDEISKFMKASDDDVFVGVKKSMIFFQAGDVFITSRLLEGRYPNFRQVIPESSDYRTRIGKASLSTALKLMLILSQEKNYSNLVSLVVRKDSLKLRARTQDLGYGAKEIPCSFTGDPEFTVSFNGQFILDVLANMDSEEIIVELTNSEFPGVFRSAEDESHVCVVMPLKISDGFDS